jgi:predicted CXXCH cytochrome family protein
MQVLLRTRRIRTDGVDEYHDTQIDAAALTLGSAPDRAVQLIGPSIAPQHARIRCTDGAARIDCSRGGHVLVNGRTVRAAPVEVGDRIEIDGHILVRVAAPAGFDLALEVTPNAAVQTSDFAGAFCTDLTQTWLSKRRAAWVLFVVILTLALLAPLTTLVWDGGEAHRPWLPADASWSTGPLHPAHQLAIGNDCTACHAVPFQRVADAQCSACHERVNAHVDATPALQAGLVHTRCATCHQEHNEPAQLVTTAKTLCTDCHAEPAPLAAIKPLEPASGFAATTHPAFEAQLLRAAARSAGTGLMFDWRFERTAIAGAKETSNLNFPHDIHLDGEKVRKVDDSAALVCVDCHQPAPDQEHFLPVTMERHCRSCHDLQFDPADPARELPHGQPMEAILAIEGHYLRKFGDPNLATAASTRRRLPDRSDVEDRCTESAYVCAMRSTRAEAVNQFTRRGCVTCHRVEDTGNQDIYSRFQVYPIRLVADFLPDARFDHTSHLTQKDASGDAACGSCHDARHSTASADLLIPDIDNCLQCHSDDSAAGVELTCIGCHPYHPVAARATMRGQRL